MKKKIVIDSSVAVKWINVQDEDSVEKADAILNDLQKGKIEIAMPVLSKYEIGNAILNKKMDIFQSKITLSKFYAIPVNFVSEDLELAESTMEIAHRFKISYYDASFVALTQKLRAIFVTDDLKLNKQLNKIRIKTIALKDYL